MENKKIVVAGHVSLDFTPSFDKNIVANDIGKVIKQGKLVNVGKMTIATGGCVSNTGLALNKLGAKVSLVAKLGKDEFADILYKKYMEEGVKPDFIYGDNDETSYSIVIAINGLDRAFLHNSAANNSFREKDLDYGLIKEARHFHFGYPSLMKEFYREDSNDLEIMFKKVKDLGLSTSLDLAAIDENSEIANIDWEKKFNKVLPYVDFFVPSIEELLFIFDREKYKSMQKMYTDDICQHLSIQNDILPLANKILSMGCKAILLKCGIAGLFLKTANRDKFLELENNIKIEDWYEKEIFQNSYVPDRVLSGTGAGDTSIAGFIYGICNGFSAEYSMKLAAGMGANNVREYDALSGLTSIEELIEKINNNWQEQNFINE